MALKDLFTFFSSDSTEKYNAKPYDPVKARKPLLKGIKDARDQFNADQFTKKNRWFSVKNEQVAFHPKLDGRDLILNGVKENHMPSDRFVEFLDLMEKEVNDGEFDEVIANHGKGNVDVHIGKAPKATGAKRNVDVQSKLNIGVAAKRRAANPPSFDEIRQFYIDQGNDSAKVDAAIAKRKTAEAGEG